MKCRLRRVSGVSDRLRIWLPYTHGGSGSDVSIELLADALRRQGHEAIAQRFPRFFQYTPWFLGLANEPPGTQVIIGNSWNAFAFQRRNIPMICVERLFVLDPAITKYKTAAQRVFHETIVRYGLWRGYHLARCVVALSENSAQSIRKSFPKIDPIVIPNGVNLSFFGIEGKRKPLENRTIELLYVGNMSRRKGVDLLVPIMDRLGEGFVLRCAPGRDKDDSVPRHRRISSLGNLSLEQVRDAYRRADVLLLPSRLEGMPRVILEAMACGLPVVASRASSMPEVVRDGLTGRTCNVDDPDDFANAIVEVVQSQQAYDKMSRASREHAERHHDLEAMAQGYTDLCRKLIEDRFLSMQMR